MIRSEIRAQWYQALSLLMFFVAALGLGLLACLLWVNAPLVSSDPFWSHLGPVWLFSGIGVLASCIVLVWCWRPHPAIPFRTRPDMLLLVLTACVGLLAGGASFQAFYAYAQDMSTQQLQGVFQASMQKADLASPLRLEDIVFDATGKVRWKQAAQKCPNAISRWERLDAKWEGYRSGGAIVAGALEASFLRSLWFRGCLNDQHYLEAMDKIQTRVKQAQARLRHEKILPTWSEGWTTWNAIRRPFVNRIMLSQRRWCEDKRARQGKELSGACSKKSSKEKARWSALSAPEASPGSNS